MKKKPTGIWIILAVTLLFLPPGFAGPPVITVTAKQIRPGDFFVVTVEAPGAGDVVLNFLGATKQLQRGEGHLFYSLAAVSYYTAAGAYPLLVKIIEGKSVVEKRLQVQVTKREFAEQRIRIDQTVREEILTPQNQATDTAVMRALREEACKKQHPPLWKGEFIWPVEGRISSGFGLVRFVNDQESSRHSGLDIAAPTGTPVRAVNHGQVIYSGMLHISGLTVLVHHGLDLFSSYAHLSAVRVREGEMVAKGQVIGEVGATGVATGPHLHLTMRVGDIAVDPDLFLERELKW